MSPVNLQKITDRSLVDHLNLCPSCYTQWKIWSNLTNDIKTGSQFIPTKGYWDTFEIKNAKGDKYQSPWFLRFLNWLDWVFIPEVSLRWALAVSVVVFALIYGLNSQPGQSEPQSGLPNKLIISSQYSDVNESLDRGLSCSPPLGLGSHSTNDSQGSISIQTTGSI